MKNRCKENPCCGEPYSCTLNTRHAAPVEGLETVAWPTSIVNMSDPDNSDARILGFRIRAGDEAFGKYGLSEALQWLKKACMGSVTRSQAEAIIAAEREAQQRLLDIIEEANTDKEALQADNAALTARVKELAEALDKQRELDNESTLHHYNRAEALEAQLAAAEGTLNCIAHTFTEGSHGNMKSLSGTYYQSMANRYFAEKAKS